MGYSGLKRGRSFPPGATVSADGVNFCVFSKNCHYVELLFFDSVDSPQPSDVIRLDRVKNRTFYYWHIFVEGIRPGQLYAYRVHGPFDPEAGFRFDGNKVLVDPYSKAIAVGKNYDRKAAIEPGDTVRSCMKSVVVDPGAYDWEGDLPLHRESNSSFIYEMHLSGFTKDPDSGVDVRERGTYLGLIKKIPHLVELGVTEVELLPVQHFDEQDAPAGKTNYWGYCPVSFFAPHSGYASSDAPLAAVNEFRDMVKALHRAGIEVILDVVFNHTTEGNHLGPTLSFRGFENRAYYMLEHNRAVYANYSGCGNTFNANQSIARRMILDALRYWVSEMHVDGFRFDLATVLSRDEWGQPLKSPPILWEIESDPVLAGTRIIAEAWDASGLNQVGSFVGHRWAEWNGLYRDDVRRFVRGDNGMVQALANRIGGSPDLFSGIDWEAHRSINFLTCHDGFTLMDLVSYNRKHNEENGEQNQDGMNENYSWNCGEEGQSADARINALRIRQIKNFLAMLCFSQGTPMIQMGDEAGRTQNGNNNAYCRDTRGSWFCWSDLESNREIFEFTKAIFRFRKSCGVFRVDRLWLHEGQTVLRWSGVRLWEPDFTHDSHTLAYRLQEPGSAEQLFVILNCYSENLPFELPDCGPGFAWFKVIDTSQPSGLDCILDRERGQYHSRSFLAQARSSAVFVTRPY
ncbi:MAG: glycogen debranching protein GlgX [Leptospirales bacterium]|nr:glycogen debranching protein GlgX [Leptospirales bacterium]